jgi:hypothetical protein
MDAEAFKTFLKHSLFSSSLYPQSVTAVDSAAYHTKERGKNYRQNSGEKTACYRGTACTIFRMLLPLLSVLPSTSTSFSAKRRVKNGAGRAQVLPGRMAAVYESPLCVLLTVIKVQRSF